MSLKGNFYNFLPPLVNSLKCYLNLSDNDVFIDRTRVYLKQVEVGVWFRRPLTKNILEAAAKNVHHFLLLRLVLAQKMLESLGFMAGIDCHLKSLALQKTHHSRRLLHLLFFQLSQKTLLLSAHQRDKTVLAHYPDSLKWENRKLKRQNVGYL